MGREYLRKDARAFCWTSAGQFCETLVLLAAHGNDLFRERLGIDMQARIDKLVRALLCRSTDALGRRKGVICPLCRSGAGRLPRYPGTRSQFGGAQGARLLQPA